MRYFIGILYLVIGGNRTVQLFFCKIPGCAANVINVFCNDKLLFSHTHTTNCMGPPQPGAVCQHDGRAYVSIDTDGDCEFEGKDGYIETQKYTGIYFFFLKPLISIIHTVFKTYIFI